MAQNHELEPRDADPWQVCAYDTSGKWAPAYPPVPAAVGEDGWIQEARVAVLAAAAAAVAGSPRVVVRDREDATVVLIENGSVTFPSDLAQTVAEMGGGLASLVRHLSIQPEAAVAAREAPGGHQGRTERQEVFLQRMFAGGRYELRPAAGRVGVETDMARFVIAEQVDMVEAQLFAKMRAGEAMELGGRGGRVRRMVLMCREAPRGLTLARGYEKKGPTPCL